MNTAEGRTTGGAATMAAVGRGHIRVWLGGLAGDTTKESIVSDIKKFFRSTGVEIDNETIEESYAIFSGELVGDDAAPKAGPTVGPGPGRRVPLATSEVKRAGSGRELTAPDVKIEIRTAMDIETLWASLEADARKKLGIEDETAFRAMTALPVGMNAEQWCAANGFKADQASRLRLLLEKVDVCFGAIAGATRAARWIDPNCAAHVGIFHIDGNGLAWNPDFKALIDRHEPVTVLHPVTGQPADPVTNEPIVVQSESDVRDFIGDFGVNFLVVEEERVVLTFLGRARLADVDPNVGYSGEKLDERFDSARYVFMKKEVVVTDGSAIDEGEREAIVNLLRSMYRVDEQTANAMLGPPGVPGGFTWTRKMLGQLLRKMTRDGTTRGTFGKTAMMWPGNFARLAKENPATDVLKHVLTYGSGADGEWRVAQKLAMRGNVGITSRFEHQDPDPNFPTLTTKRRRNRSGDIRLLSWAERVGGSGPRTWMKACGVEVKNWDYGRLRHDRAGPARSVYSHLGDMAMQALEQWRARGMAGERRERNDAILNGVIEGIILAVEQDGVDDVADYGKAHKKLKDMNDLHPLVRVFLGEVSVDELRTNLEGKTDEEWDPLHLGFTVWWAGDASGHAVGEDGYTLPTLERPGCVLVQPQRDVNLFMLLRFAPVGGSRTRYKIEARAGRLQLQPDQYRPTPAGSTGPAVDTRFLDIDHVEDARLNSLWFKNPRFGEAGQPEYIKDDPVYGSYVEAGAGMLPDLAWIGTPEAREVYATTGMGGTAEPGTLLIEAITDGVSHEETSYLRALALAELLELDGVAVRAALKEYRDLIKQIVTSSRYANVLPQQIGRNTPILGLLFDVLSEAYGCYEGVVQYLPEILAAQLNVNALDVTRALESAPEKYKNATQMTPFGSRLKNELETTFKPLTRIVKRGGEKFEENVFRLRMGEIALIVGDKTSAMTFEDSVGDRVKDYVKRYPFELMEPLAEAAWGLGIGARKLIFPPGSEPSEKGGRWNEEREGECLGGISEFVRLVKDKCGRPEVFDQPGIKMKLKRLRQFVRTGVLDGGSMPGGKRYYVVKDVRGNVDYSLGRAGMVEYSDFLERVYKEYSAFAKEVYVAMGLVAMKDLDHLTPRDQVCARYGLGQEVERSLRVEGKSQLGAMLWAGLRGRHIPLLQIGKHTRVEWNYWVSSFLPSHTEKPLVMNPFIEMQAFLRVFFSETLGPKDVDSEENYFQTWSLVQDRDGKEHWREIEESGERRVYFELVANRTKHRVVGYLTLDLHGHASPFVDGFTVLIDPESRVPTVRWDETVDAEARTCGLPVVIDEHGNVRDVGAPDAPFLETQVEPKTWQCLNVLLPGWTFTPEEE